MNNFGIDEIDFKEILQVFKAIDELEEKYIYGSRARG